MAAEGVRWEAETRSTITLQFIVDNTTYQLFAGNIVAKTAPANGLWAHKKLGRLCAVCDMRSTAQSSELIDYKNVTISV